MTNSVIFEVPFVRGKGRVRFVRATGRTYTPDRTAEAMEHIRLAFLEAAHGKSAPKGTPVSVLIMTSRSVPASRPKRVEREPDIFKPDADNVAKLVLDALNGTAWADDTQVTNLQVIKVDRTRDAGESTRIAVLWKEAQ